MNEAALVAEAEAGYDPEKLLIRGDHGVVATVQIVPEATGLVGMFDSGRSDLASRAKDIVRGREPVVPVGDITADDEAYMVKQILAADWHRDQCGCDALPKACMYAHLIPVTWTVEAVLDALRALQGAVEGGDQARQDPAQ